MQTFKQYIRETYSNEELKEIAEHGCQSGCASTLIYYHDTNAQYDHHAEELHEMVADYMQEFGQVPDFIGQEFGNLVSFKNAVVWFCAELIAWEITNNEEQAA